MTSRSIVVALVVVGISGVAGGASNSFAAGAVTQDKAVLDHGMKVYEQQKCSLCHSVAGKGNKAGSLDGVGATLTPEEIRQWLVKPAEMTAKTKATRKPPMRAFASLPEDDLAALVAYVGSLKTK